MIKYSQIVLGVAFFLSATGCLEEHVRLYVEVDKSCNECCEGLNFKAFYRDNLKAEFGPGESVMLPQNIGGHGKLAITVYNDAGVDNHPLKCQKCVSSLINIQGLTPLPVDGEVYVYYNQVAYFQNQDVHATVKCKPLPDETPGLCEDVYCWDQPEHICVDTKVIELQEPRGVCSEGECIYQSHLDLCWQGWCYADTCGSTNACENVYCMTPPPNVCKSDRVVGFYEQRGVCSKGECIYASTDVQCPSGVCSGGACVDLPCANKVCDKAPANYCLDSQTLRSFNADGRCTAVGGQPKCEYAHVDIECKYGCNGGTCVAYGCAGMTCDTPPANYCDLEDIVAFTEPGFCEGGACRYIGQTRNCNNTCRSGKCQDDYACVGMRCRNPPAPWCVSGSTLRTYPDTEWGCNAGKCVYGKKDINCPGGCSGGRCVGAPCTGVVCNKPPANYCIDEDSAMEFTPVGTCEGDGTCKYAGSQTLCEDGCYEGWCP